jgi:hypothetical protein
MRVDVVDQVLEVTRVCAHSVSPYTPAVGGAAGSGKSHFFDRVSDAPDEGAMSRALNLAGITGFDRILGADG